SYTSFKYSDLKMPATAKAGKPLQVEAVVKNVGNIDGEEVVQLYLSHPEAKGKAPIRSLQGFQRIALKKGESRTIKFVLNPEQLMLVDENGNRYQGNDPLLISVGGGQPGVKLNGTAPVLEQKIVISSNR